MSWMALSAFIAGAGLLGYIAGILVSTGSHWRQSVEQSNAYQNHFDELLEENERLKILADYRGATTGHPAVAWGSYTPTGTHTGDDSLPEQIRRRLDGGDGV